MTSEEGKGSRFCFKIIFGVKFESLSKSTIDDNSRQNKVLLPEEVRHLNILLAEDNTVNQKIATKILEKFGWTVTPVLNGQEVLNLLNTKTFDVILMDDQMPQLSGIDTTQVIRREEKQTGMHVPIIAMTANAMAGDRERYLQSGMDGYVSKPIDRQALYDEIVKVVTHCNK